MARLSHEEAGILVFPLGFDQRLMKIREMAKLHPLNPDAKAAFDEIGR
jgi:hypothetical protein